MKSNVSATETWLIDARVDLTATCTLAEWHRASAIDALVAQRIDRADAEAFVAFRFALAGGSDPESYLSDAQYARLSA